MATPLMARCGWMAIPISLSVGLSACDTPSSVAYATRQRASGLVQYISLLNSCGIATPKDRDAALRIAFDEISLTGQAANEKNDRASTLNMLTTRQAHGEEQALDPRQCIRITRDSGRFDEAQTVLASLRSAARQPSVSSPDTRQQ